MASTKGVSRGELDLLRKNFPGKEIDKVLVTGLLTTTNKLSGSRQALFNSHVKKCLVLNNPETPFVYTGYEFPIGQKSGSHKIADSDYQIIAKIFKHTELPGMTYLLVLKDLSNNVYHVQEVSHYESLAEMHGYMRPEIKTDYYEVGSIISKGEKFYKGNTLDEYDNYRYGINANVAFVNTLSTVADAIMISDEFAKKCTFHTIEETELIINLNDILLNVHGDNSLYKCLPSLGEEIRDGILCARRKINFSMASSILTNTALSTIMESDEIFRGKGRLIDLDIKVNRHEELLNSNDPYKAQLKYFYQDQLRYHKEIYDILHPILMQKDVKYTHQLKHVYDMSRKYINNVYLDTNENIQYSTNNGKFEFVYLNMKIAYNKQLDFADKLSNRSAAKGVISAIIPKEEMYRDEYGNYCDVLLAGKGIIGRLNIAQLYEQELNFISNRIVHKVKKIVDIEDKFKFILEFIKKVNSEQGDELEKYWKKIGKNKKIEFIKTVEESGQLYIYQPPFHDNITLEGLAHLYDYYKIKPSYCRFKMRFKKNEYQQENIMSDEEYDRNRKLYNYIMTDAMDEAKITKEMLENSENIIISPNDKREYIKSGKTLTTRDKIASENNSIWKKLISGIKIVKDTIKEMDKKTFNSPKSQIYMDENGDIIRDMRTVQPLIIGKLYMIVMKQISDTGFSARSLGSINPLGNPIKDGKIDIGYPFIHSPIKFSFMDICNISIMINMELIHRFKSIHASNPELRREMAEVLLTMNPFKLHNLSTKLEETTNDISARMFKAYFFGIAIMFLENGDCDPFEMFDYPEYADLHKIYRKYGDINIPREQLIQ